MKRRKVFKYIGATAGGSALTDCLHEYESNRNGGGDGTVRDVMEEEGTGSHPWSGESLTVSLRQEDNAQHGINEDIIDAVEYWNQNARRYAGFNIDLNYRPNSNDPDILIRTIDNVDRACDKQGVQGCAPVILDQFRTAPEPADIRMTNERTQDPLSIVVKHEIGHTLGLGHDDEPQEIMSADYQDRLPNYEARMGLFNNYHAGVEGLSQVPDGYESAIQHYENGNYRRAASQFSTLQEGFRRSEGYFNRASYLARRIDERQVESYCNSAADAAQNMRYASSRYSDAAEALLRNNRNRAEQLRQDGKQYHRQADPNDVTELRQIYRLVISPE